MAAVKTFLSYQRPWRTKRTAIEIAACLAISAIGFFAGIALQSFDQPTFLGTIGVLIGIVTLAIGSSLSWLFATGAIHDVRITDRGVSFDGKEWPWESVIEIRTRTVAYLSISVRRPWFRTRLFLPIELKVAQPAEIVSELKDYLSSSQHDVRWR